MGVGLALAGGGIRGIAHVGVLKAFEEKGIKIEAISGTSAGSIVAALYAMGYRPYYIYVLFKKYAQDIINIRTAPIITGMKNFARYNKIGFTGLNDGVLFEKMYNELATKKGIKVIGDIKMPIAISTVDILEPKEYIITNCASRTNMNDKYITEISVGKAVRASSSFPAVFCPCEYKKHLFMDGGVLDNIPVLPLKEIYKGKIIAVNFEADKVDLNSDLMDIVMKTLDIMGNKITEEGLKKANDIISVPTDGAGLFDIEKLDLCYEYGYKTAMKFLENKGNNY